MSGSLSVSSAVQLGYLLSVDNAIRVQDCLSVSALTKFGFHFSALGTKGQCSITFSFSLAESVSGRQTEMIKTTWGATSNNHI